MTTEGLHGYDWQISYGPSDDRLQGFYLPALSRSVRFDRATGFFSSAALAIAAAGVARLIQNGGKMRLLCGAQLSREDVEAIRRGEELGKRVGDRMVGCLAEPRDHSLRARLQALAWMVAQGTLEIQVVLPRGPDGHPLPAEQAREYYHPKEGVFEDAAGDRIAFSGSSNESEDSWRWNYEVFAVYRSWDFSQAYLVGVARRFEALWQGKEKDWIALPIPEAARAQLLRYRPDRAPTVDPLEAAPPPHTITEPSPSLADQNERILFQFVRDAPFLAGASRLGQVTSTVRPWPHQQRVADLIVSQFPQGFLLCDEVGLGKTIEAGLALRQLVLSGRVRRALILTPKSVSRQWQEELYEKLVLNVPRYDGGTYTDAFDRELPASGGNPWDAFPLLIASSQLAKRRERHAELVSAEPWDLVLVDEAHHARRKDFLQIERNRPNRLLELLRQLKGRTKSLILLTATPMQIHPVEVWDLLHLLGVGGKWGAGEENFLRFFDEMRKPAFGEIDWEFVLRMVRDELLVAGGLDAAFAAEAQRQLGPVEWQHLQAVLSAADPTGPIKGLSDRQRAFLLELARRHTPLRRLAQRNTRALLRRYRDAGILKETVPDRDARPAWIPFRPGERELYDRIEEYISDFYRKYESERKGLGFIMTVYRRRLTSSFYAIERSLERRLAFLQGRLKAAGLLDDDDAEQEELELDVGEEAEWLDPALFAAEIDYVKTFLHDLRMLGGDSKLERLLQDLTAIFAQRETVLIFTQYTDTMDFLRDRLRDVYGTQVACYSGRGGERWDGTRWVQTPKEAIKQLFREGESIKILLGTEAASEGLNLQTCGVLINFDVPWNPMRVEQRIGRIDRIGQKHQKVWIRNYFYEESVEATIYRRLEDRIAWFETVVGELQPILAQVATTITDLAMLRGAERTRRLDQAIREIRERIDATSDAEMDLDRYVDEAVVPPAEEGPTVSLGDLEKLLLQSKPHAHRFRPHPEIAGAYVLGWRGEDIGVTFDPTVFDEHPVSLHLLSYGDEIFQALVAAVSPPASAEEEGRIIRCASEAGEGGRTYFSGQDGHLDLIETIRTLREVLESSAPSLISARELEKARQLCASHCEATRRQRSEAGERRQRMAVLTLEEEGRQLLLRAALIELAIARQRELWDAPGPSEFSEAALGALRSKGYPFAPLLQLVSVEGVRPSPADPFYLRIQEDSRETLGRRMDAVRNRMKELLEQLAKVKRVRGGKDQEAAQAEAMIAAELYQ